MGKHVSVIKPDQRTRIRLTVATDAIPQNVNVKKKEHCELCKAKSLDHDIKHILNVSTKKTATINPYRTL